jgi:hypothetical protein
MTRQAADQLGCKPLARIIGKNFLDETKNFKKIKINF